MISAICEMPSYSVYQFVFYNSPYQFVAIQQMAKWLHPELFRDLDPDQTMRTLYERFLPVSYKPGYWVSLSDKE